jgi:outer membrane protein assembly factor BamA
LRINAEQSGNLLSGMYTIVGSPNEEGRYEIMKNEFAQYLKGDIDLRYYQIVDDKTSFVYRVFLGVAHPYGNSVAIPFEKQYFTGGANGIRAWPVRNLGPGTYRETRSVYPNATADIKLEANFEYRFKLFWILEGALFADAGNIWTIRKDDKREGTVFNWNTFYKQIAVGTGVGLRMDFSFFIFRIDLGLKARDPSLPSGPQWVILNRPDKNYKYTNFHVAIGYPF